MKQQIITWVVTGGGAALILSRVARALPKPDPMGSKVYQFAYNFAQTFLSNPDQKV